VRPFVFHNFSRLTKKTSDFQWLPNRGTRTALSRVPGPTAKKAPYVPY
jgi:hypothetical protein